MRRRPMAKAKSKAKKKRNDSFESVAKRLGCDDDKDRFESRLAKIAKAKPSSKAAEK